MACNATQDGQMLAIIVCYTALLTSVFAANTLSVLLYRNNFEYEYKNLLKIDTGYSNDPAPQEITEYNANLVYNTRQRRYNELECTYLISSLWHMRLVQSMLASSMELKTVIEVLTSYGPTAQKQVATLVDLDVYGMKKVWQLYLYTQLLGLYSNSVCCSDALDPAEGKNRLTKIHETHLKAIKWYVGWFCQSNNEFELRLPFKNHNFNKPAQTSDSHEDALIARVKINISMIDDLMDCNEKTASVPSKSIEFLSLQSLYFNDFGRTTRVDYIVTAYNVQIDLKDFPETLASALGKSRCLHWSCDNLKSLTEYHTMCLDFVKAVWLRLTLKHILYLNDLKHTRMRYIKEWSNMLLDFLTFFELLEDEMFAYLLVFFANDPMVVNDEFLNERIRNEILSDLTDLSTSLGCEADGPMVLDGNEFITTCHGCDSSDDMSNLGPQNSIQTNSIGCAKSYIAQMKKAFENVDFKVIRKIALSYDKPSPRRFRRRMRFLR
ncbi:uncharacterized protein LOC126834742 [Adelges cooleyi]|uniref:uncharacterized protein LOC126834742 n=1 Tax=Adelges cooleyi TaxID=133065 RepID=UPI00217FB47F|nr:uncharacterized protein LOC126834742 [Adelges cooleyi]